VVLSPPDADFAERLLSGVRYRAEVTRDEYVPTRRDNIGNLLLNAFILIGILLVFSVVSGLALGGFRALARRGRKGEEADAVISLHLEQR
jgi:type II secretory pathway pseudopilin PulG